MGEWKPTIGKWYDDDNYDIKEPFWRTLLNEASKYRNVKDIQEVICWLNCKNLHGDLVRMYIIGFALCDAGVDLRQYFPSSDAISSKINYFYNNSDNLIEYTVLVMKEFEVADEFIDEFKETRSL